MNFFFVIKNCYYNKYINFLLVKVFGFGKDWSTGLNARQWLYINFYILFRCIWIFFSYLKKKKEFLFETNGICDDDRDGNLLLICHKEQATPTREIQPPEFVASLLLEHVLFSRFFFFKFFKHVFHWTKE